MLLKFLKLPTASGLNCKKHGCTFLTRAPQGVTKPFGETRLVAGIYAVTFFNTTPESLLGTIIAITCHTTLPFFVLNF